MPIELAQYGIGFFAVGGLVFIIFQYIKNKDGSLDLKEVVKNNTRAMNGLTSVLNTIQIELARQDQKIDEILERTRK